MCEARKEVAKSSAMPITTEKTTKDNSAEVEARPRVDTKEDSDEREIEEYI